MVERDAPSVVIRVRLFGEFEVEQRSATGAWEPVSDWGKGLNAKQILKYLLSRGRMARRQDVVDALWEQSEPALAEDYLIKAVTKLRQALRSDRHGNLLQTVYNRTTYTLADQSRIWVDADACEEAIREAEAVGITNSEGVRLLEQAAGWFDQGPFLAGEGGLWSHGWRGRMETAHYRCLLALIDGYIHQQTWRKAEERTEQLLREHPIDEQVLGRLMHILHTQGWTSRALQRYRDTKAFCQKQQLPFPSALDVLAQTFEEQIFSRKRHVFPPQTSFSGERTTPSFPPFPIPSNKGSLFSSIKDRSVANVASTEQYEGEERTILSFSSFSLLLGLHPFRQSWMPTSLN